MKHLKTFENFSINEEEGIRKFFTGHDSAADRDKAMRDFYKALDEAEAKVNEDPEKYNFDRETIEARAKENNYRGGIRIQRGGRNTNILYVVYDAKASGFEQLASAAGGAVRSSVGGAYSGENTKD